MRLLHTSDWHLGRRLHGADLTPAHAAWVDHLVEVVRSEGVEVVLVAGDVFDRAVPPVESLRLWEEALERLTAAGAAVVVSSGNHDSPVRLGVHHGLLAGQGVHVRCDPARVAEPVLLHDVHGAVALYPLPFLEPTTSRGTLAALAAPGVPALGPDEAPLARSQAAVVSRAARLAHASAEAAGHRRTVLLAHTWVAGVRPEDRSDSERDIGCDGGSRVGTLDRVPLADVDAFGYAALGHLHGPQTLAGHVRYSGSPVAFSFSERHHRKGSWLVELDGTGLRSVDRVDAPQQRPLVQLQGALEELLADPAHEASQAAWVKAVLTDAARPVDAMRRLQQRFPHAVALEWRPEGRLAEQPYASRVACAVDDTEVAVGFVEHVRGTPASTEERGVLAAAFGRLRAREAEGLAAELAAVDAGATGDLDGPDGLDELTGLDGLGLDGADPDGHAGGTAAGAA